MRKKQLKSKKSVHTMDVILVIIAVALLAFTVEMIALFKETGMVPDTLVTCVFAALGGGVRRYGVDQNSERAKQRTQLGTERPGA